MSRGADARRLVRKFAGGVLTTQSVKFPGYPYASSLPFCTDQNGRIVVLISHLAEHTQNADANPKVGFLVSPLGRDLQEQARLSMIGDCAAIDDVAVASRYLRYFPEATQYLQIGGFRFFRIEPRSLRYIAGFGSIHTIAPESYLAPHYPIADAEGDVIAHMNADHAHNLIDYCRHVHGKAVATAAMVGVDCDGFDVRADSEVLRFDFGSEVKDAGEARTELVKLAQASRA
jgi:heme oxygenase (biliverdin-IX-beta and delta-forming)